MILATCPTHFELGYFYIVTSTDVSYVRYSGDSYLEFQGVDLGTASTITMRFQTLEVNGTLLYSDQGRDVSAFFFIKLFIHEGTLQVMPCVSNAQCH